MHKRKKGCILFWHVRIGLAVNEGPADGCSCTKTMRFLRRLPENRAGGAAAE